MPLRRKEAELHAVLNLCKKVLQMHHADHLKSCDVVQSSTVKYSETETGEMKLQMGPMLVY